MDPRPDSMKPGKGTALVLAGLGAAIAALGAWGLATDVVWISQPFYAYGWWGWILLLDGFCVWRRGSSLLTTRRGLLPILCTSSVTFWILFEALNLRFRNWYYVGTFELRSWVDIAVAGTFVVAAFSTVFVGMFEVFDALGAAGILKRRRAPRRLPAWLPISLQALGLVMACLALAFPYYLAPLIWGSFTFLLDPWNYRRGHRSLLRDIEAGDGCAVSRLFLAGLISGLVWESLNFAAPQKWIYTVRGLEAFKLFEMPLLGFLGFPALAFDAVTAFALLSAFCFGGRSWEHPDDLLASARSDGRLRLRAYWWSLPLQAVLWTWVTLGVMQTNIGSVRLRLQHMPSVRGDLAALEARDIRWPRQLRRALADGPSLAEELDWEPAKVQAVQAELELFLFKGIGFEYGRQLQQLGVSSVEQLSRAEPRDLHRQLVEQADREGLRHPHLDWVRVWVLASRDRGILMGPT